MRIFSFVAALFAMFALAPAYADEAAEAFVQAVLDEAEPAFNLTDEDARLEAITALVDKYVDMRKVGFFTLGQYARRMSDEQKAAYFPLFRKYATLIYRDALSEYSGERLVVTNSIDRSERDIIVNSEVAGAQPGQQFANLVVHWRVYRSRDGAMSVVDAGANDIWLAIEQRSQFTSIIANNGGGAAGIDALIAQLRKQVGE